MANGDEVSAGRAPYDWPYAGYEMTVFSNTEEVGVEDRIFQGKLAFYAADALRVAGGLVTHAKKPFEPHAVRYRELITGQNPASDHLLASLLLDALQSAHE
jgi:putative intracellular protease/amidase